MGDAHAPAEDAQEQYLGCRPDPENFRQRVIDHSNALAAREKKRESWCSVRGRGVVMSEDIEFALADYNPSVLTVFCTTIAIGYGFWGFQLMQNKEGRSLVLYKAQYFSFYVEALLAATTVLLLSIRGRHTAVIARHYQVLAGTLLGLLYSLNLVQRSLHEIRQAHSPNLLSPYVNVSITTGLPVRILCADLDPWATAWVKGSYSHSSEDVACESRFVGGASMGVQMAYFTVIAPARLHTWTAIALVSYQVLTVILAVSFNGAIFRGGERVILFFVFVGLFAICMAQIRTRRAFEKWKFSRRLCMVRDANRNFLSTLIPPRIFIKMLPTFRRDKSNAPLAPPPLVPPTLDAAGAADAGHKEDGGGGAPCLQACHTLCQPMLWGWGERG